MPRRFAPRLFLTISQKVKIGGGGGIRTRGILRYAGLVNRSTRPLCDPSLAESTGVEPVRAYAHEFSRLTHYRPAHSPTG